jgi:hypothetical protein
MFGVNIGLLSSPYLLNCSVCTEAQKYIFHRPGPSCNASDLGCFFCWGAPFLRIFLEWSLWCSYFPRCHWIRRSLVFPCLGVFTTPNELEEILFSGILHLFGEAWTFWLASWAQGVTSSKAFVSSPLRISIFFSSSIFSEVFILLRNIIVRDLGL